MTQRERVLVSSLLGVAVLGGGALLVHVTILSPLRQLNGEIAAIDEDIRKKDEELKADQATIARALKLSPRLAQWKQLSLPAPEDVRPASKDARPEEVLLLHLMSKRVQYEKYLYGLLERNGFEVGTIIVESKPLEAPKTGQGTTKGPPPIFRALPLTVRGRVSLDGLVKMLEEFHRANLLQQVRSIDVKRPSDQTVPRGTLDVTMGVEALLVFGAEKRVDLMPASSSDRPHVLAESARSYPELAAHNIFTGQAAAKTQSEDARDVLGFVKLTTVSRTNDRRWEGWLNDQARKDGESRLRTTTGFNEFSYSDRYENVLVRAVVIRIDQTGVLFKANGRFYLIHPGDSLYDALREPAVAPFPAAGAAMGAAWEAPW
jgi:hypothetical protein